MNSVNNSQNDLHIDDPRFRITPVQQMAAACTGALITSFLGESFTSLFIVKKFNHSYV